MCIVSIKINNKRNGKVEQHKLSEQMLPYESNKAKKNEHFEQTSASVRVFTCLLARMDAYCTHFIHLYCT